MVNKNLSVFTTLPNENDVINNYSEILETLMKNYSLILLDCDFETNFGYFKEAQEIYLAKALMYSTINSIFKGFESKKYFKSRKIKNSFNKSLRVENVTYKLIK